MKRWILLLAVGLAVAVWLPGPDREPAGADEAAASPAETGQASETSSYRLTGANWSVDRTQPVYVPPHQRRAMTQAPRRKADAAARTLDDRSLLEESAATARLRPGTVVDNPYPGLDPDEVAIE